jgi:hypothetical protein
MASAKSSALTPSSEAAKWASDLASLLRLAGASLFWTKDVWVYGIDEEIGLFVRIKMGSRGTPTPAYRGFEINISEMQDCGQHLVAAEALLL